MNKKGFTLIELLAVIVILAIIALIATPIVIGIIEDSKNSSQLRSAELYLKTVENAIGNEMLDGTKIDDRTYDIIEDGDLCKDYKDGECINKIDVDVRGEVPKEGTIKIEKGNVKDLELMYDDVKIGKDSKGNLFKKEYEIGKEIIFNPGDQDWLWNVIDEEKDTITLMLSENIGDTVDWYESSENNHYGPITALNYLNTLTSTTWTNVDIIENYSYVNNLNGTEKPNGYQKLEIYNGRTTLTHKDGKTTLLDDVSRARFLTQEEILEIASKTNKNFTKENLRLYIKRNLDVINTVLSSEGLNTATTVDEVVEIVLGEYSKYESEHVLFCATVAVLVYEVNIESTYNLLFPEYLYQNLSENGDFYAYWTLSSDYAGSYSASYFNYSGNFGGVSVHQGNGIGVRPVITISKTKLK